MIYGFADLIAGTEVKPSVSAECLSINGRRIEDLIDGYLTLYVSGRETPPVELQTIGRGNTHGNIYRRRRYESRSLTIGYRLQASTAKELMRKFNELNSMLAAEEAKIVIDDEPDKMYIGTVSSFGEIPAGRLQFVSEFTILCSDPFKYSVDEKTGGAVTQYKGNQSCHPTVTVTLKSDQEVTITLNGNTLKIAKTIKAVNGQFTAGDVIKVDTSSGKIYNGDDYRPDLNVITNDYDGFFLRPGENAFSAKDGAGNTLEATLTYREVWL